MRVKMSQHDKNADLVSALHPVIHQVSWKKPKLFVLITGGGGGHRPPQAAGWRGGEPWQLTLSGAHRSQEGRYQLGKERKDQPISYLSICSSAFGPYTFSQGA